MPAKKMPIGKRFKKGQSGNPAGRPKVPDEVKEARKLNKIEFTKILTMYLNKTKGELDAIVKDKNTKALDMIVISIITNAVKKGDNIRLNFLMDRIIGKVKEEIKIEGDTHTQIMKMIAQRQNEDNGA